MTDPKTLLNAGKRIAAIASGRAYTEEEANKASQQAPDGQSCDTPAQPTISDEPPIPDRDELPGTPHPAKT